MKLVLPACLMILASFILQEFIPASEWAYGARLLLVHTVFLTIAVALPFPAVLGFAALTGFLWDARYYLPIYSAETIPGAFVQVEIPFGFTIFLFGLIGSLIQGVRPLFRKGRWELPVLMIAAGTGLMLLLEYFVICFHRGNLELPPELWWKLLMTSLFSALVSPILLLLLSCVAGRLRYKIRMDGLKRRHSYDGDAL